MAAPTGKGGRKALDAELNLVPFIDLLSCCISFLLITAVWTQLSRIDVKQKGESTAGTETQEVKPELKLTVVVDDTGYHLSAGEVQLPIPKKEGNYDTATLETKLKELKRDHQDKNDVTIASDDTVKYDFLVQTMDAALSSGFPDIALVDVGQAAL
jgi:biopolymer transport protein ExbD